MKSFIFLTNQYLPKPGATGLCVHQIAKRLVENGNSVTTICYADGNETDNFDGVKTVKIDSSVYGLINNKKISYLFSLISKLLHIWCYPLRSCHLVNNYINEIEKILKNTTKNITIVASFTPLEACIAAARIRKKYPDRIKAVYYSADTLSNEGESSGILPNSYRIRCGEIWEKKLFTIFDKIILMECHKEHYVQAQYSAFKDKISYASFPLFSKLNITQSKSKDPNKIRLVYTGTMYKKLRNPKFLCKILCNLANDLPIEVYFLGGGDCDDILMKAEEYSNGAIKYIGMQPHEDAIAYINSADILLSIGNVKSSMAPSKIYEYMSTGKPIIHVYEYDKDPCIEPLHIYGNSICIMPSKYNRKNILDFINKRTIKKYEITRKDFRLATPEYTAELLLKVANNGGD